MSEGGRAAALGIGYRAAEEADHSFLAEVYISTRRAEVAASGWAEPVQTAFLRQQFEAQHAHYRTHYPDAQWLVIEQAGRAIGRLYRELGTRELRLIDIALLPDCRGRGIGAAIIADLIDEAGRLGRAVSIHVERNNPAMSLYTRLGFVRVEQRGIYELMERRPPGFS